MTDEHLRLNPNCTGKLTTRSSWREGTGTIKRRRECSCCQYVEIATVRPAEIIKVRCVKTPEGQLVDHDKTQE